MIKNIVGSLNKECKIFSVLFDNGKELFINKQDGGLQIILKVKEANIKILNVKSNGDVDIPKVLFDSFKSYLYVIDKLYFILKKVEVKKAQLGVLSTNKKDWSVIHYTGIQTVYFNPLNVNSQEEAQQKYCWFCDYDNVVIYELKAVVLLKSMIGGAGEKIFTEGKVFSMNLDKPLGEILKVKESECLKLYSRLKSMGVYNSEIVKYRSSYENYNG